MVVGDCFFRFVSIRYWQLMLPIALHLYNILFSDEGAHYSFSALSFAEKAYLRLAPNLRPLSCLETWLFPHITPSPTGRQNGPGRSGS